MKGKMDTKIKKTHVKREKFPAKPFDDIVDAV
jgi:hypothetical protein